jgi:DNA-binding PadR family transcriptional regulator
MKTELSYRYQEILTALNDHPDGLTTGEIYQLCRSQPGSELPDSTITGQCIYGMNKSGYVSTVPNPNGRNRHEITDKGREALAAALGIEAEWLQQPQPPNPKPENLPALADRPDGLEPAPDNDNFNLLQSFDAAVAVIRSVLEDNLAAPPRVKIRDKAEKMETLENLANSTFLAIEITEILAEISADIDRLDEDIEA